MKKIEKQKNRKTEKQKNRKTVTNILCLAHLTKAVAPVDHAVLVKAWFLIKLFQKKFALKSFQKRLAIESFLKVRGTEQKYVKFLSHK
jgi:predicted RNA-binding protein associated with RNAse of E/G family